MTTLTLLTNIKGDKGDKGDTGDQGSQGLPGTGAVPADSAVAGYLSTTGTSESQVAADARYVRSDGQPLNVLRYGAKGDGATDDTAAIQSALDAATGRTVLVPAGTYMVNADLSAHVGLTMTKPGVRLLLDPGATLKVIPNASDNYALVSVTAADCVIEGGTFLGDSPTHTGTTGEWGLLIVVDTGGDRCRIQNLTVKQAWGDGITVQRGPVDVSIIDVIADDNRRQGVSITGSIRTRVLGGVFKNTGLTAWTLPCAGIDIETNPSSGFDVIGATVVGATFYNNRGEGLLAIQHTAQVTDATVSSCLASGNGAGSSASGFRAGGSAGTMRIKFVGCQSVGNSLHGFEFFTPGVESSGCTAKTNTVNGFELTGVAVNLTSPVALENGGHGIHVGATSSASSIVGGTTASNSQTTTNTSSNVSFDAAGNVRITGHIAYAGGLTNKPKYGYEINTGAGIRMFGCDISGTYGTANYVNTPGATMVPAPGFGSAAAITSPSADVTALKTAVDALRIAVAQAGITK